MPTDVVVRIISARYGLLRLTQPIAYYDRQLDQERDQAIVRSSRRKLSELERRHRIAEVFAVAGAAYLRALPTSWQDRKTTKLAAGPPGARVRAMLDWLLPEA